MNVNKRSLDIIIINLLFIYIVFFDKEYLLVKTGRVLLTKLTVEFFLLGNSTGVRILYAYVSEHTVCCIFIPTCL